MIIRQYKHLIDSFSNSFLGQWGGLHELDRYTDTASGDNQFPLLAAESQTARRNKPHQLLQEFQSGKVNPLDSLIAI